MGSCCSYPNKVISFIRSWRLVDRWCLSYLDFVEGTSVEPPLQDYMHVIRGYVDIDLLCGPLDRDVDSSID